MLIIFILAILQGMTEFLPVSSSGHLVIFQHLLSFNEPPVLLDVLLHTGTTLAVIVWYRKDIFNIFKNIRSEQSINFILMAALVTVITGSVGIAGKKIFESVFENINIVAVNLFITGILLIFMDRQRNKADSGKNGKITLMQAFLVGFAQSIAIFPGISRSGSTIAAGVLTGMNRENAARFSLLVSVPAILGATLLETKDAVESGILWNNWYLAGILIAFVVGYLSIGWLIKVVQSKKMKLFAVYCWTIALLALVFMT